MTSSHRLRTLFLTLKDYPERLEKQRPYLSHLETLLSAPVEIYYGVNGREVRTLATADPTVFLLQHPEHGTALYDREKRINKQQMSPGEFGCAWTHWNIYKKLLADPTADAYLVIEDDARHNVSDETLCAAFANLPAEFDVCRIASSQWYPYEPRQQITPFFASYAKKYSNGTVAYIVSKTGAAKILLYMAHELSVPSDDLLSNMNLWSDGFKSYVSTPILFTESGDPSILAQVTTDSV
jgi:GR25 family glycosyltransferase involved in LPS biosynthesis